MRSVRASDIARLLLLSAIWGASFIFIRVLAPLIGAVPTALYRIVLGGAVIVAYAAARGMPMRFRRFWRAYAVVGVMNSGAPFVLIGIAALVLPASYLAIINAATPLFGAVLASVWLAERLTARKVAGLLAGCAGVALVSKAGPIAADASFAWAVAASLAAAFCYAAAGIYLRLHASEAPPIAVAGCSQLAGALVLVPVALVAPGPAPDAVLHDGAVIGNVLALGLLCSALAYLLYYRLMADVGPTRTLTVALLLPLFAMLWSALFLNEQITWPMLAGCGLIVGGTLIVLRPASLHARSQTRSA